MSPLAGIKNLLASHSQISSARKQQSQGINADPLSSGHEMQDYYAKQSEQSEIPNTEPYYTPYLGLRARLSQTWINKWTVLILLIIVRLLLSMAEINSDIASAKAEALSACTSVETVGSAMASMPHYLSQGVNHLAADGITKAVNGLMEMLLMSITAVEEIVLFVIHMMTSTYMCLITLAVNGSLQAAIAMIEDVGNFMNKSINSITGDLASNVQDFQNTLNGFLTDINIGGILSGGSSKEPTIDLSGDIAKLNSIQIDPTTMDAGLTKLNNSLPTFDQVQNFTDNIIKLPFEEVKKLINSSMTTYVFDDTIFPVPKKEALTFCSGNNAIEGFFTGIVKVIFTAKTVILVILSIAAVLACIPMAYREIWKWRSTKQRAAMLSQGQFDKLDVLYIATRPYTATFGFKLASRIKSPRRQVLVRWFIAYATSVPALFVLCLGLAGLFSCFCQFIVLKTLQKEVPVLAQEVGDFASTVVTALNNASESWAVGANSVINDTNTQINHDVFGWVNTTTGAINDTLNAFSDEMVKALNETFGGTILYQPIMGVFECLVGLKIAGVEKGLTWVSDNAHVNFPEFNKDVFSLGAAASLTNSTADDSFLASPGSDASDEVTGALKKVADKLMGVIRQEAAISLSLVGIWLLIVLIGAVRMVIGMMGRDKTRAEGGPRTFGPGPQMGEVDVEKQRTGTRTLPHFDAPESASSAGDRDMDHNERWNQAPPGYTQSTGGSERVGEVRRGRAYPVGEKEEWRDDGLGGRPQSTYPVLGDERWDTYGYGDEKALPRQI